MTKSDPRAFALRKKNVTVDVERDACTDKPIAMPFILIAFTVFEPWHPRSTEPFHK